MIRAALLALALAPMPALAGECDLIPRWDQHAIDGCFRELKSEVTVLRLRAQAAEAESKIARNNLCLLAMELKTPNAYEIAEIACTELWAAAKKKAEAKAKKQ